MAKCLYCYLLENGDIPEDTKDILNRKSIVYGCYSLRIGNSKFNFCPMCGKSLKDIEGRTV